MEQKDFDDLVARLDQAAKESEQDAKAQSQALVTVILGDAGHGKRTTLKAMEQTMAARGVELRHLAAGEGQVPPSCQGIETDLGEKSFRFILCPDDFDNQPHTISALSQASVAIVVVDATAGVTDYVEDLLDTARTVECTHTVFYVNKCDLVEDDSILDALEAELVKLTEVHMLEKPIIVMGCALGVTDDFDACAAMADGPAKERFSQELAEEETSITGLIESVNYAAFAIASGKAVKATNDLRDKMTEMLGDSEEGKEAAGALNQLLGSLDLLDPNAMAEAGFDPEKLEALGINPADLGGIAVANMGDLKDNQA